MNDTALCEPSDAPPLISKDEEIAAAPVIMALGWLGDEIRDALRGASRQVNEMRTAIVLGSLSRTHEAAREAEKLLNQSHALTAALDRQLVKLRTTARVRT